MKLSRLTFGIRRLRSAGVVVGVLGFATSLLIAQPGIRVPYGKAVMLDGQINATWNDAVTSQLAGIATLYVKQSEEYIWLALRLRNNDGAVDLYISPSDNSIYDLHASAKLGERRYSGHAWPEWSWWNNQGWIANVSRVDSFEKRTFMPTKVREFQIRKTRFPGTQWKMMVEVLTPADPEWKVARYPKGCINTNTEGWLVLKFDHSRR